jgi:hypothetical protein
MTLQGFLTLGPGKGRAQQQQEEEDPWSSLHGDVGEGSPTAPFYRAEFCILAPRRSGADREGGQTGRGVVRERGGGGGLYLVASGGPQPDFTHGQGFGDASRTHHTCTH